MKKERQEKIKEIIENYKIDTQDELIKRLKDCGYSATQATMSRDIKDLKLTKISDGVNGYYYVFPNTMSVSEINKLNTSLHSTPSTKVELVFLNSMFSKKFLMYSLIVFKSTSSINTYEYLETISSTFGSLMIIDKAQ